MIKSEVAIIGGGLTGLALQYLLKKEKIPAIIIEARNRLGGRIYTLEKDNYPPIEMGATWFGDKHISLITLLKELGLETFPQQLSERAIYEPISTSPFQLVTLPTNESPSYRIKNGTAEFIKSLARYVDADQLYYKEKIKLIKEDKSEFVLQSNNNIFKAKIIVSTLPPALFKNTIAIQPSLPNSILELMEQTHTWMGDSIKISLIYKKPFWRDGNTSGTIFSNVGPISELYDHSNYADNLYALKGFLNGAYHSVKKEERIEVVLNQLKKYYGQIVEDYTAYEEVVWRTEKNTYVAYEDYVLPHQNNGHALYQQGYLNGRLYIAGSETALNFSGYMEGAIQSAISIYHKIKKYKQT